MRCKQFTQITRQAFRQFVNEQIQDRLQSALERGREETATQIQEAERAAAGPGEIETTEDEFEAFHIVKAILREVVGGSHIAPRDLKSYFGILLDDNNRKPLCRLHFGGGRRYIGLFDNPAKKEDLVRIESLEEICKHADRLKATPAFYG